MLRKIAEVRAEEPYTIVVSPALERHCLVVVEEGSAVTGATAEVEAATAEVVVDAEEAEVVAELLVVVVVVGDEKRIPRRRQAHCLR